MTTAIDCLCKNRNTGTGNGTRDWGDFCARVCKIILRGYPNANAFSLLSTNTILTL